MVQAVIFSRYHKLKIFFMVLKFFTIVGKIAVTKLSSYSQKPTVNFVTFPTTNVCEIYKVGIFDELFK
jgi:hypothetical protein